MPRLMPTDTGEELWTLGTPVSEPAVSLLSVQGGEITSDLSVSSCKYNPDKWPGEGVVRGLHFGYRRVGVTDP